jgi:hypothetical protein
MRQAHRLPAVAWHLLLVGLFALPLTSALWHWTAVACTHDGHLHSNRVAAIRYAWENGLYLARWLPDVAFGYGYPFFVYREPLPLYAVLMPHLWGLPLPAASNLVYLLSIVAAGLFTFLWVRDVLGARAGVVAAVAYMAAPYMLIDALVRGNLPESIALAFLPFFFWVGRRWLLQGSAGPFVVGAAALALFNLTHNISLLLFTPALVVYLVTVGRLAGLSWPLSLGRTAVWLLLGMGMTLFYPAGALLEMDQVTLEQSVVTRNNDFRYNFASLAEIAAPVTTRDPNLINPPLPFRLGWTTLLLAGAGLLWLLARARRPAHSLTPRAVAAERRGLGWLMLAIAVVYLFFSLPLSRPIWEAVPLIDFVQFPWRFIGRAALPLAFLAALPFAAAPAAETRRPAAYRPPGQLGTNKATVAGELAPNCSNASRCFYLPLYLSRETVCHLAFCGVILLFLLEALPHLYPNVCQEEAFPAINSVHLYERVTGLVGVDPEGSYFPRSVRERPQASALEADYQAGRPPQRFDTTRLPAGAKIVASDYGPLSATVHLTTPEPFTARYLAFSFPGWQVKVNGQEVAITPGDPDGLITFPLPAGTHEITVRWRSTPLRSALMAFSLLATAAVLAVTVYLWRRRPYRAAARATAAGSHLGRREAWLLVGVAITVLALKLAVVDRRETIWRQTAPPAVRYTTAVQAAELKLEGFNMRGDTLAAGHTFDVDLAWRVTAWPRANYQSNLWLATPDGLLWSDKETQRPRLYESPPPTTAWQPAQWAWDSREVTVLPGTPPGLYDLVVTLFDLENLQPLTLRDGNGAVLGPTAVIGQVTVTNPLAPRPIQPQHRVGAAVAGLGVSLVGYDQDRQEAAPGDPILITLFWQRDGEQPATQFTLDLLDEWGRTVHSWPGRAIIRPNFAAEDWPAAAVLRDQQLLRLPATLADGRHRFRLQDGVDLGNLDIRAPERFFDRPPEATAVTAVLNRADGEEQATLSHYLPGPISDNVMALTLFWQTSTGMSESYHIFVHLVDERGQLLAQSDGVPAGWLRPTTGWIPGEYVADNHLLTLPAPLPAGPLTLRVGVYDPVSGRRFQGDGADFVVLPLTLSE